MLSPVDDYLHILYYPGIIVLIDYMMLNHCKLLAFLRISENF